jgi:hypothetical protein
VLQAKASSFEKEVIMRASQAAAPLAMWVKANVRFSLVIEKIQPLEVELAGELINHVVCVPAAYPAPYCAHVGYAGECAVGYLGSGELLVFCGGHVCVLW